MRISSLTSSCDITYDWPATPMMSSSSSEDVVCNIEVEQALVEGIDVDSSICIEKLFPDEVLPNPKRRKRTKVRLTLVVVGAGIASRFPPLYKWK